MARTHSASVLLAGALAAAVLGAAPSGTRAQDRPSQPPVFKSGVELITIDVKVVDKNGRPVRGLAPSQFEVSIDGRPRRVVSAEIVDHVPAEAKVADAPPEASHPAFTSNDAPARTPAPGRLIFILVDQGSFRPMAARGATEAARRFVQRLQPRDRVGLVAFPPPGPSVAASRNHAAVLEALRSIVGSAQPLTEGLNQVSVSEAIDIDAGDMQTLERVIARECGDNPRQLQTCRQQIQMLAHATARRVEMQARESLDNLRGVVSGLARLPERKTLVLIGAGIPTGDRLGPVDVSGDVASIARIAAGANANIYVLHTGSAFLDAFSASERRISETVLRDAFIMTAGLENIAAASGGTLLRVESGAEYAFDRILLETSASYVLAVEPEESDRNGKPHTIKVAVKVAGAQVRSRTQFALAAGSAASEKPEGQLQAALRAPRLATALPLGVSTRTLGRTSGGILRVLVAANVGRGLAAPLEAGVGYLITDATGEVAAGIVDKQQLPVSPANPSGAASYTSAVVLRPGEYNLRLAALDSSGRLGSVDHPFSVGLASGDGVSMGDLLLANRVQAKGSTIAPVVDGRITGPSLETYVEVLPKGRGPAPASVSFGIAERADGEPLVQVRAPVSKDAEGRLAADARLDLSLLPPGDYFAVAIVSDGRRPLGRRHQPLRIEAPMAAVGDAAGASVPLPRVRFVVGETRFVKAFARADVLGRDTLAYFTNRLQAADERPAPPGVAAAATALRAGDFDAVLSSLASLPSDRLSVAFLKGVALLGKGELEPAAKEFREALRIADDFLPAAFYLGACYAAGGRDGEAVGAWQTALVTESEARIVYDVLADALLREDDAAQAADILAEARGLWPDDPAFLPRLAAAQAMMQRRGEALDTLAAYLDRHQSDAEAAALAIRLIYEAHAAGVAVKSPAEDRELAVRYGALYRSAGGANVGLVDRWVAFISK